MKRNSSMDPDATMDEIMRLWPSTIPVILRHGMLCVGCPIAGFHTTHDACVEHGIASGPFLRELEVAARKKIN